MPAARATSEATAPGSHRTRTSCYTFYAVIHRDLKDRIVFLDVRGESTRTVAGFLTRVSTADYPPGAEGRKGPLSDPEHLDPRQGLPLQPFEEGAAGGRDISEPPGRAGRIERRDRVTAARHRDNVPGGGEFRRRFGDLNRADVERLRLEGAERPVPDQRLDPREHVADMLDAARTDVQNHLIAAHAVHRDHVRGRVGGEGLGNHGIDRQYELAAFGLRHDFARSRQQIALAQRFT